MKTQYGGSRVDDWVGSFAYGISVSSLWWIDRDRVDSKGKENGNCDDIGSFG